MSLLSISRMDTLMPTVDSEIQRGDDMRSDKETQWLIATDFALARMEARATEASCLEKARRFRHRIDDVLVVVSRRWLSRNSGIPLIAS